MKTGNCFFLILKSAVDFNYKNRADFPRLGQRRFIRHVLSPIITKSEEYLSKKCYLLYYFTGDQIEYVV